MAILFLVLILYSLPLEIQTCDVTCSDCADCTTKISAASPGQTVCLDTDVQNTNTSVPYCIGITNITAVSFDCLGYSIVYPHNDFGTELISVLFSENITVSNCRLQQNCSSTPNNEVNAVNVETCENCVFDRLTIEKLDFKLPFANGLLFNDVFGNSLTNSTFSTSIQNHAVSVIRGISTVITENQFLAPAGMSIIWLRDNSQIVINQNLFDHIWAEYQSWSSAIFGGSSDRITISDNEFRYLYDGIELDLASNILIENNDFFRAMGSAIYMATAVSNTTIVNNRITGSRIGLNLVPILKRRSTENIESIDVGNEIIGNHIWHNVIGLYFDSDTIFANFSENFICYSVYDPVSDIVTTIDFSAGNICDFADGNLCQESCPGYRNTTNECHCTSCTECSEMLSSENCLTVFLDNDIFLTAEDEICIFQETGLFVGHDVIFDCQDFGIFGMNATELEGVGTAVKIISPYVFYPVIQNCVFENLAMGIEIDAQGAIAPVFTNLNLTNVFEGIYLDFHIFQVTDRLDARVKIINCSFEVFRGGVWVGELPAPISKSSLLIEQNSFKNGYLGIVLFYTSNPEVHNNYLKNMNLGINIFGSNGISVLENKVEETIDGMHISTVDTANLVSNKIRNVGTGFSFRDSNDITFFDNEVVEFSNTGIEFTSVKNGVLWGNKVHNGDNGLRFSESESVLVYKNEVFDISDIAVEISSSNTLALFDNVFISDGPNAIEDPSSLCQNGWNPDRVSLLENIRGGPYSGGNFWGDYLGVDVNGDGFGDTLLPFTAEGNFCGDELPLAYECPESYYPNKTANGTTQCFPCGHGCAQCDHTGCFSCKPESQYGFIAGMSCITFPEMWERISNNSLGIIDVNRTSLMCHCLDELERIYQMVGNLSKRVGGNEIMALELLDVSVGHNETIMENMAKIKEFQLELTQLKSNYSDLLEMHLLDVMNLENLINVTVQDLHDVHVEDVRILNESLKAFRVEFEGRVSDLLVMFSELESRLTSLVENTEAELNGRMDVIEDDINEMIWQHFQDVDELEGKQEDLEKQHGDDMEEIWEFLGMFDSKVDQINVTLLRKIDSGLFELLEKHLLDVRRLNKSVDSLGVRHDSDVVMIEGELALRDVKIEKLNIWLNETLEEHGLDVELLETEILRLKELHENDMTELAKQHTLDLSKLNSLMNQTNFELEVEINELSTVHVTEVYQTNETIKLLIKAIEILAQEIDVKHQNDVDYLLSKLQDLRSASALKDDLGAQTWGIFGASIGLILLLAGILLFILAVFVVIVCVRVSRIKKTEAYTEARLKAMKEDAAAKQDVELKEVPADPSPDVETFNVVFDGQEIELEMSDEGFILGMRDIQFSQITHLRESGHQFEIEIEEEETILLSVEDNEKFQRLLLEGLGK